ncbi:MAG: thiamine-phosphate kinase [Omnitrophica WOR_2 bacterium GWA2_47_8]|nr:MAG: thiamine-phosphate kinase [Omnitrophica WOR_2 bacterium GWA2_47_8]
MKRLSDIGEFGFIDLIKKGALKRPGVIKGIGDDTAVLSLNKDKFLLFTTDMLIEDVHFLASAKARDIGYKAMACNISDIAAMGGIPTYAVVSIGLPVHKPLSFALNIYKGINALCRKFNAAVVGGDTVKSDKVVVNIALLGEVRKKDLVLRNGARKGDQIFVTGPLGNSLKTGRHLSFIPRVKEAQYLVRNFNPTAMIDISDGLAADLGHILEQSKVGAILHEKKIPFAPGAALKNALYDGEDFELLFTLPILQAKMLLKQKGLRFYHIGEITKEREIIRIHDKNNQLRTIQAIGYKHF